MNKTKRTISFTLAVLFIISAISFLQYFVVVGRKTPGALCKPLAISGEYSLRLIRTRHLTTAADNLFVPDTGIWSNAQVIITQPTSTNLVCTCLSPHGGSVTNAIAIDGKHWRWTDGSLKFSATAIGPGLGFGALPGVLRMKEECVVEPERGEPWADGTPPLRVKFKCQMSGWTFPFGRWRDPGEESEILLVPKP